MLARITLFLAVGLALYLGLQAGGVWAKAGVADIVYAPDAPVAGRETIVTFSSLSLDDALRDPDCAIGAGAVSEPDFRLFLYMQGSNFSVEMQKMNSWQYRTSVIFPKPGMWQLVFDRRYPQAKTGLLSEQNRSTIEVLALDSLPGVGGGSVDGDGAESTTMLAYALVAFGCAVLLVGVLGRLVCRRV